MQSLRPMFLLPLGLLIIAGAASVAARDLAPDPVGRRGEIAGESGANLLANPSFEGEYSSYKPPGGHKDCPTGICDTVKIADGWTPWWVKERPTDVNPEYKPAELVDKPRRVWSGDPAYADPDYKDRAQQYFSFSSTHKAGVYQRVAVQAGKEYCFSIWGHSWSSHFDDSFTSDGILEQWVGIDPTGGTPPTDGTNWDSSDVIWGPPIQQYNKYGLFNVCAEAQANHLTVFTRSEPKDPVKHNDVYWDDAVLSEYDGQPILFQANSDSGLSFLVDVDQPQVFTSTIKFEFPDIELPPIPPEPPDGPPKNTPPEDRFDWHSIIEPGNTLTPVRSATGGQEGEDLIITVDSSGLPIGTYSAVLRLSSEPTLPGSPEWLTVELLVAGEVSEVYIPYTTKD